MKTPFLKIDDDLILHQPQIDFAEALFALIHENRTYLSEFLPWVDTTITIEDTLNFLKDAIRFNQGGQQFHTIIIYQQKIIGAISLNSIYKAHQKAEIGYWLAENMQGKGIVTKAAQRLIHYSFQHLNLYRLVIKVNTQNFQSQKVAQRLGFTYEGTLRSDFCIRHQFVDIQIYGLLKSECKF